MTKKMKKMLIRILAGGAVYLAAVIVEHLFDWNPNVNLILYLLAYFIIGGDVIRKAIRNISNGRVFDENFLMLIATIGAFAVGDLAEAVAVMLFYQVGELFQSYAVNRSRRSISELMDIRPDYANLKVGEQVRQVSPEEVKIGDLLLVKPGEKIPLDAVIIKGESSLDTKALTGEPMPRDVGAGDRIISGCINLNGVLEVRAEKEFGESTVSRILKLVESQGDKKAKSENFISRFARYYTPAVVAAAVLLAVVPSLFNPSGWQSWVYRACSFLVISCPCALVISVPLSFFAGLGCASKNGILIKGSNYLEALAQAEIAVFDKTGTLTKGEFRVIECNALQGSRESLLELAAYAEAYSTHPIAASVREAYGRELNLTRLADVQELAGYGVRAKISGFESEISGDGEHPFAVQECSAGAKEQETAPFHPGTILVEAGNAKLMEQLGIEVSKPQTVGTVVYVAVDGNYIGSVVIADQVREDAARAVKALKQCGVRRTVMLTGDTGKAAQHVGNQIGIDEIHSQLLPADKVEQVEKLYQQKSGNGKLLFVGDGMNDAPVLARADVGVAMGGMGSQAAIEAADMVIMTDEPSKIARGIQISRKTLRIVRENIVFAIGVKFLVLILAAFGVATMWAAVFADVGVAVIAICNAIRALRI